MGTLSFEDLKGLALPSLWDTNEILKFRLEDGASFESLLAELNAGMTAFNGTLTGMPQYSTLWAAQDVPEVEYRVGDTNGFEEATEYTYATPRRGATTGHMIGLRSYDRALGWTLRYLQKARRNKLDADVASVLTDARNLWQKKLLERFFRSTAETVGNSAASVPFADGGTADSAYVPPTSPRGETFTSSHNHFLRQAATLSTTSVDAAIETLYEHGHMAPYLIIIPDADRATWAALSNWRKPTYQDINYQAFATPTAAGLADVSLFDGFYESPTGIAYVWSTPRLPANYYGVYKHYGPGDQRNPLRVRFDPNVGFGFNLVPGMWANKPLEVAVAYSEFGVGVGQDRTNGVAVYLNASGDYVAPTIS